VAAFALAAFVLALASGVAARLRFPALPLYLLAGLLASPWVRVGELEPLPTLGLLLLLFSVGLEFGPDRLSELSKKASRAGLIDALALPLGAAVGWALGLELREAVLFGGVVYISSSAVIAKLIVDLRRAAAPESEVVLGILVFEDLLIALVLALFGGHGGAWGIAASAALVFGYLLVARLLAPRVAGVLERAADEPVLLFGTAFTVGTAVLFHALGGSEGVGAFLSGVVAAGLGLRDRIERLFGPLRDLAAALFFLAVGSEAVALLGGDLPRLLALALLAILLKLPLDYLAGRAAGLSHRRGVLTAFYLVPRGEFNLVLGALAAASGEPLVGQVAVLLVLISVPLGAVLFRYGPEWTKGKRKRKKRAQRE